MMPATSSASSSGASTARGPMLTRVELVEGPAQVKAAMTSSMRGPKPKAKPQAKNSVDSRRTIEVHHHLRQAVKAYRNHGRFCSCHHAHPPIITATSFSRNSPDHRE